MFDSSLSRYSSTVRGKHLEANSGGGNCEDVVEVDNISPNIPSLLSSAAHGDK